MYLKSNFLDGFYNPIHNKNFKHSSPYINSIPNPNMSQDKSNELNNIDNNSYMETINEIKNDEIRKENNLVSPKKRVNFIKDLSYNNTPILRFSNINFWLDDLIIIGLILLLINEPQISYFIIPTLLLILILGKE